MTESPHLRIGALSRRAGVSPELLRAWEDRYGLVQPVRSTGGFRLYSTADEERIRVMLRHLAAGVSAAEAARLSIAETGRDRGNVSLVHLSTELRSALDRLDESAAHTSIDRLLATFTLETVLRDVVLSYLHELGERWENGKASVAQEHFASSVLRGRLLGLSRGWGQGSGSKVVLACAPGELHDLPLIIFGLTLAGRGRRITNLGPDTPIATIQEVLPDLDPQLVVIAAMTSQRFRAVQEELSELARSVPVALAGTGATDDLARATGAFLLEGDPVTAAQRLAEERQ